MSIFHIVNRGVEKRNIFLQPRDYLRFIHNLKYLNNTNTADLSFYKRQMNESLFEIEEKDLLVDILAWCLMPNHFHLLVSERKKGNTGKFSKKITSGYTQYFNLKNNRSGVLFQGKTKIIPLKKDPHFLYIPFYIFTNPVKLKQSNWKTKGVKNKKEMLNFIENYKWSSYQEILDENKFPDIINKKLFFDTYGDSVTVKKEVEDIVCNDNLKKSAIG